MKRFAAALALVAMIAGLSLQPIAAKSAPLDGRLGGAKATFEKRFGKDTGQDEKIKGLGYAVSGFGAVVVAYVKDQATTITIVADRTAHTPLERPGPRRLVAN
jgi:hypothetical protein